jgi:4a-hydroxytetrahydrobiopterin dehydratase
MAVGVHAEIMGHHPEWFNVYSTVRVNLVTHDIGNAISNLDVELAKKMEEIYSK